MYVYVQYNSSHYNTHTHTHSGRGGAENENGCDRGWMHLSLLPALPRFPQPHRTVPGYCSLHVQVSVCCVGFAGEVYYKNAHVHFPFSSLLPQQLTCTSTLL